MLKLKKINHVAVVVEDANQAIEKYAKALGLEVGHREVVESQKVEAVMLPIGDASIELLEPRGSETLKRFLEKRGPGLHHIAIEVEGLDEGLVFLKALGVPLIDETARIGAHGHKVAFVHPKATGGVLIELVEPV